MEESRITEPAAESTPESTPEPATDAMTVSSLAAIRLLRAAGGALFTQAVLHGQLARVEWAKEKIRLAKMLVAALLSVTCLLCVMLFAGILVLACSWETAYRIPALLALIGVYGIGAGVAWHRVRTLSALSDQAFAATREELAADIALIRSKL